MTQIPPFPPDNLEKQPLPVLSYPSAASLPAQRIRVPGWKAAAILMFIESGGCVAAISSFWMRTDIEFPIVPSTFFGILFGITVALGLMLLGGYRPARMLTIIWSTIIGGSFILPIAIGHVRSPWPILAEFIIVALAVGTAFITGWIVMLEKDGAAGKAMVGAMLVLASSAGFVWILAR